MNYTDYKAEDFIGDESFQNWYYQQDERSIKFWQEWISKNPEKSEEINRACKILASLENPLHLRENPVSTEKIEMAWSEVEARIRANEPKRELKPVRSISTKIFGNIPRGWYYAAAALIGLAIIIFSGWWVNYYQKATYITQFGERKTVQLPDSTKVILNANSRITFNAASDPSMPREVWLKGEAYFDVQKKPESQKFIVHTGNLDVEVLGTSFNVNNYQDQLQIVLDEGKIRLEGNLLGVGKNLMMEPGEMVEKQEQSTKIVKKQVNPRLYTAWKDGQLIINNTSINTIARVLENNYGYEVIIKNPELRELKITSTATIPLKNFEVLLEAMSALLDIKITTNQNQIIFGKKDLTKHQ